MKHLPVGGVMRGLDWRASGHRVRERVIWSALKEVFHLAARQFAGRDREKYVPLYIGQKLKVLGVSEAERRG